MDDETRRARREAAQRRVIQQRRRVVLGGAAALVVIGALLLVTAFGGKGGSSDGAQSAKPAAPPSLPRGGRTIFPRFRVVAYYGAPQDPQLGELGIGKPDAAFARLARQARAYARPRRPVLPAGELLITIAAAAPGDDGLYRIRQSRAVVDRYLKAARRAKALLILDIQPGRSNFMDELRPFADYLEQPDVGLALDPEWHVGPNEVPGRTIGSVTAQEVNRVSAYVADVVRRRKLPDKLLLIHRFTDSMIVDEPALVARRGVETVINVDGFGGQEVKIDKYVSFRRGRPFRSGFKLFYHEDTNLMTPRRVLRLRPRPDVVVYE